MLAGPIRRTEGDIWFHGGRKIEGPRPDIAMVFQRPVLLPWRRVIDNVLPAGRDHEAPADGELSHRRRHELLEMARPSGF